MKLSDIYQSRFLSAADITNGSLTIILESIGAENLLALRGKGEEQKLVAEIGVVGENGDITKHNKRFVIGRQNAKLLAKKLGDDTDDWVGATIVLSTAITQFGESIVIQSIA